MKGADWLAWALQFILGLIVGLILGAELISSRHHSFWMASEAVPAHLLGAALIVAALASYYGDRLWLGSSYRIIPTDGIRHSAKSRAVSISTGVVGGILVIGAILKHFAVV
jgi:TRAP-type C4-dicarboxylate transport system permease small subunit